jgi:glycosyltransferase involved in cell wall biosynthesis
LAVLTDENFMLHVAQISFFLDPQGRTPEQIFRDWWPLVVGADMVARAGARVTVIQACAVEHRETRNGVSYIFIAPDAGHSRISSSARFRQLLRELDADIFHIHGMSFSRDVIRLARLAPTVPIFIQDHADRLPRLWRRRTLRQALAAAAGVSFCAHAQARPFLDARVLSHTTRRFAIAECSSPFRPGDAQAARRTTGVYGEPAVLMVGHLDPNKDPLTVLAGISAAAVQMPGLQLWCCFGTAPLLADVKRRIACDPQLTGRVHLLGKVPHATIEQLMRAADFFVSGSHREGSGGALLEALACGLTPIVTDIPSFRMLTDDGRIGKLWRRGDPTTLSVSLVTEASRPRPEARRAVRDFFDAQLSIDAVGRQFVAAYQQLIAAQPLPKFATA